MTSSAFLKLCELSGSHLTIRAPFYSKGLTLIPTWISNYIHYMWGEITYSIVEVWEWVSNFIPHLIGHVIAYPWWHLSSPNISKWGPKYREVSTPRDRASKFWQPLCLPNFREITVSHGFYISRGLMVCLCETSSWSKFFMLLCSIFSINLKTISGNL